MWLSRFALSLLAALILLVGVLGVVVASAHQPHAVVVRGWPCEEDEIILGVGDYNGRRYEAYVCEARDDL